MSGSVFQINKGINKSIEFKGLKAQYIWYFAAGVLALLVLFAIMYIIKINSFICIGVVLGLGTGLTVQLYSMSGKYGEHGLSKKIAKRGIPKMLKVGNRKAFIDPGITTGYKRKK
jgi:hypothetical protein